MKKELLLPNITDSGIHRRYNETIVNKEVEIGLGQFVDTFQGSHFKDCVVRLRTSATRTLHSTAKCTFEDCLIWASRKHAGANWNAHFKGCSFRGRFELRFSHTLVDCDFSKAKLSFVAFLSDQKFEDLKGLNYPHIALLDVQQNFAAWEAIAKPADYKDLVWTCKKTANLIILNLEENTKHPQVMWQAIKSLPFVETRL